MKRTLTLHLLARVFAALAIVWATFAFVGYKTGEHEADELTDGHLASVAAVLLAYQGGAFGPAPPLAAPAGAAAELKAHDYQQSLSVVVWDAGGTVLTRRGAAPLPAFAPEEGFATLQLGQPAQPWRAFSRWDSGRQRKVMVLVSQQERDDLADDIAGQVTQPALWLLPVIALALGLAIRRGLKPLYELSHAVGALDVHRPQPLAASHWHEELQAIAAAVNALAARYQAALARERALASEFAHELRTPLASLALQARTARDAQEPAARGAALARLERDALRAGDVLTHLLALARASRAALDEAAQPLDLAALAHELVAEAAPQADAAGREVELVSPGPFAVQGHAVLLQLALRNLLDNALHHSAPGSRVSVELDPAQRWVQVCDAPPASPVPPAAAPEAAVLGLGLGHRVVEKIAALHGARFEELDAGERHCYRIAFGAVAAQE